jgi:penicillin-binding protein 1A
MTIVNAFAESRNIPALKLAARVGIHTVIDMAHRFGVTSTIPAYLPVALGAVEISLQEQVASYSVFPNDGVRVTPHLVHKVSNADGVTLWEDRPVVTQVIDQQTARTMMILLQAVTAHGTGAAVAQMNHPLGGKTGTTSDFTDAWFLGFSPSVTCGVWVGFDSRESLGEKETGARAALPIWMTFMKAAIAGKPDEQFPDDGPDNRMLKAAAAPPSKPGRTPSVQALAPAALARSAKPANAVKPAPSPQPVTTNGTSPSANQPTRVVINLPADDPQVRPASQLNSVSDKANGEVKPAPARPQH